MRHRKEMPRFVLQQMLLLYSFLSSELGLIIYGLPSQGQSFLLLTKILQIS